MANVERFYRFYSSKWKAPWHHQAKKQNKWFCKRFSFSLTFLTCHQWKSVLYEISCVFGVQNSVLSPYHLQRTAANVGVRSEAGKSICYLALKRTHKKTYFNGKNVSIVEQHLSSIARTKINVFSPKKKLQNKTKDIHKMWNGETKLKALRYCLEFLVGMFSEQQHQHSHLI